MESHPSTAGGRGGGGGCSLIGESISCRLESRVRASTAALWSRNAELCGGGKRRHENKTEKELIQWNLFNSEHGWDFVKNASES